MRQALLYLPGLDGTGQLLHRQPRLFDDYEVRCLAYPQHRPTTCQELAVLASKTLAESSGRLAAAILAESFGGNLLFVHQ